jgi:hypothetical protein
MLCYANLGLLEMGMHYVVLSIRYAIVVTYKIYPVFIEFSFITSASSHSICSISTKNNITINNK